MLGTLAAMAAAGLALYLYPQTAVSASIGAPQTAPEVVPPRSEIRVAQAATIATTPLPGGASEISETYQDWRVACSQHGELKTCAMTQQQVNGEGGQRILAIEIKAFAGSKADGILVLPFGLALDAGVVLQVDDGPAGQPMRFRTCLPAGCVIALSFDGATIETLRNGAALKALATADGGAAAPFSISLQGFNAALDRVAALTR